MNIEVILANYDFSQVQVLKSIAPLLLAGLIVGAISLAVGIYTFLQMRKMQKKNRPKPNQIDGTIADEGVSFCDIAGSPHIHPNITDLWNKKSEAIKQKSGGFLGIGKSSQVTGYRYYTSFAAFIGNRIEKFLAINFDNRGWIVHDPEKHHVNMLPVNKPGLFGQDAGGVVGNIDIEFGFPQPQQNLAYKQYFDLVSAYPYQSYLVFRGNTIDQPFYFGNSNYMKEMLLWVKRIHVKNDGGGQWYDEKSEIGTSLISSSFDSEYVHLPVSLKVKCTWFQIDGDKSSELKGTFPLYDANQSYNGTFTSQIEGTDRLNAENMSELSRPPATIDTASLFNENGDLPKLGGGFIVPKVTWSGEGPPSTEGFVFDGISVFPQVRKYSFSGEFNWGGGVFDSAVGLGNNDATIDLFRVNLDGSLTFIFSYHNSKKDYEIYRSSIDLQAGIYRVSGGVGERYSQRPRPFVYFVAKIKEQPTVEGSDINPIHKIREILTDDTSMAKPEADVNDVNFIKAADRIWDEGLGVSWAIDEKSCIDAIEELCYHIEAGIRVNRQTGLYEMVLFRDDWFDEDEIHTIAENKIKDLSLEVMNSDDIVNQLNVTYYDRERIKNSTFSVYENGSILTMGKANAESIDFPYFMNMRNAEIVANWKLKQYSTPAWKGTFTTGWREARKWNRYDLVKITWSKKWQGTILARIMKIDLGNGLNNEVMIDFEEVVPYSGEMNTSIVVDDSTEEKADPAKPAIGETFEAPYYIAVQNIGQRKVDEELVYNQDVGFTFSTYRRPQWNALYAEVLTSDVDKPENGWVVEGNAEFVTSGQFDQLVSRTMTQIPVKNLQIEDYLNPNDLIVVGTWLSGEFGSYEFMIVESFDTETNILTVKRGALDTIPRGWDNGMYFFRSNPDDGLFSLTEYSADQNVRESTLTVTPSSKLEQLGSAPVYMRSRLFRPYPPANVKFNGVYYPETIITTNDIVLTWLGRNRLANQIIDFYDTSSDTELNTTYSYELISEEVVLDSGSGITGNTATILSSALIPNKPHTLKLWSVRDGYESYQAFEHSFFVEAASLILTATATKSQVVGNTAPVANITVNVDESLSANMKFDGSSISGKAQAGAIITIEIEE